MPWYETEWFREWLRLAKRSYHMYYPMLRYNIPPKDTPNNFGKETPEVGALPRKQMEPSGL
jgi:hypothetical protein